jgi:hypothetical protein
VPKPRKYRWVCPLCGAGVHLGARPHQDATGRYCLPCSVATDRLVRRVCPVLEKRREAAQERQQRRQKAKRAARARSKKSAAQRAVERAEAHAKRLGFSQIGDDTIHGWFLLLRRLPWGCAMSHCSLTIRYGNKARHAVPWTSGHAWYESGEITITVAKPDPAYPVLRQKAEVLQTILHELAHPASWMSHDGDDGKGHGWPFKRALLLATEKLVGREIDCAIDASVNDVDQAVTDAVHEWLQERTNVRND